ncbi:MAG: phage integrase N-terminal SAM-like domain-containing protein, partial [Acidobacteriaceae bacterium]
MIESVSVFPSFQRRHRSVPLLKEREQFLTHLLQIGWEPDRVRATAGYLVRIVQVMGLTSLRNVELSEIQRAGERWADNKGPERIGKCQHTSSRTFAITARQWLRFHGALVDPAAQGPFDGQLEDFKGALQYRGLAAITIRVYVYRIREFLRWVSTHHDDLSLVTLPDVDDYLARKREAGLRPITIATLCNALRAFFLVAEDHSWCQPGIWRGIVKPTLPTYTDIPMGPSWADVRRLIRSVNGRRPEELRARALFLLLSIYGLRVSEVMRLR